MKTTAGHATKAARETGSSASPSARRAVPARAPFSCAPEAAPSHPAHSALLVLVELLARAAAEAAFET